MVKTCSALYCSLRDTVENRRNGISFHRFPKDVSLRMAWAKATKREGRVKGSMWIPPEFSYLCSKHFSAGDFEVSQETRRLRCNVIPSIFQFPNRLTTEKKLRKPPKLIERTNEIVVPSTSSQVTVLSEHSYCESNDEVTTLKHKLEQAEAKVGSVYKRLRSARKEIAKQSTTIKNILEELNEQKLLNESDKNIMQHCFSDLKLELTSNAGKEYSEDMKKFACTLNLYSPKAYNYVRQTLNLPCRRTLRRWVENIDGNPGICKEMFCAIRRKIEEGSEAYKHCTVVIDGMSIKKHVEWDDKNNKMIGLVDYGQGSTDDDTLPVASEVLVIMAVGVLGKWKAPLAYYLVDGIKSNVQATLVEDVLLHLLDMKMNIVGFVCDGCYANQQTLQLLGTNFALENFCNFITVDKDDRKFKIPVILDACHMLKLLRNIFADYRVLKAPSGFVEWKYVVKLQNLQQQEMLSVANKLTKNHVDFRNNKMKVKLAAQVLSNSVATALVFCKKAGYKDFSDVDATVEFIKIINHLFDVLNSKNIFAKGYKAPISAKNWLSTKSFLFHARDYLLSLAVPSGQPLYVSRRKTSILGFITNINSIIWLYETYVQNSENTFKYLLTYKWSQDHLELFFGCVRQSCGCNNNPSAKEFRSIFKKMLFRSGVTASKNSSVLQQDETFMLDVSSVRLENSDKGASAIAVLESIKKDHHYAQQELNDLSILCENVISYIAGFVARKLVIEADCCYCREALTQEKTEEYMLTVIKDNGGLIYPSNNLRKVIHISERILRCTVNIRDLTKCSSVWGLKLETEILQTVLEAGNIFPDVQKFCDIYRFLKSIIRSYLKIRRHYATKTFNINLHEKRLRQVLTKTVLFKNQ